MCLRGMLIPSILFEEGVTLADLLDKKRGKFAWFSHSSETHGNTSCVSVRLRACYGLMWWEKRGEVYVSLLMFVF